VLKTILGPKYAFEKESKFFIKVVIIDRENAIKRKDVKLRGRLRVKCDGTRAETRFRLSAQRTS
jgi:hypothetical protein